MSAMGSALGSLSSKFSAVKPVAKPMSAPHAVKKTVAPVHVVDDNVKKFKATSTFKPAKFNLKESLKKPMTWKPYTGALKPIN